MKQIFFVGLTQKELDVWLMEHFDQEIDTEIDDKE
jgi:hypothetical protein